ncbi:hypothetical protein RS9917_12895 [Synechococcus sp. RS9917]|nr:hypothetical protein RS9917_12895 [Synechococcus sp. RS9917]
MIHLPFDQLLACHQQGISINARCAHLQHSRPPMAHPVQRLHRLALPPPFCQRGGHDLQRILSAVQPEHRHQRFRQELADLGAAAIGHQQHTSWSSSLLGDAQR